MWGTNDEFDSVPFCQKTRNSELKLLFSTNHLMKILFSTNHLITIYLSSVIPVVGDDPSKEKPELQENRTLIGIKSVLEILDNIINSQF